MHESPTPTPAATERWAAKFFTIWGGQVFSLVGSALVQFALVWWLTQQTGSATILATASLVALLPQVVLGPFVGALVDRWNRRLIMIVADAGIAAVTGVLIFLFATELVQVWHIYAILFIRSLGGAFHHPAMTASTSLMVPHKHLTRISGLNQLLHGFLNIFAPPLGALLLGLLPTQGVLAIDIGTAALAILPLLFVAIPQPPRLVAEANGTSQKTSYWGDLANGFRYVVKWPGLLGLILLAMLLNFLLSPSSALLPLLVMEEFKGGAAELGWVESFFGVGVIVGGLTLSAWGGFKKRIITSFMGIIGIGVGVILTGLAPASLFWLLLAANFILGFAQVYANGPIGAIFQTTIEPDYQGRVFSLISAGATGMMPLSLLIAGPVADWVGVRVWYVAGGAICILVTIAALFIPALVNIEDDRRTAAPAQSPIE
ncbi:MAG: MFS transporter [Anaerolineales bacterium]|nr:MFS transporter [Anaerolineales bacterium]